MTFNPSKSDGKLKKCVSCNQWRGTVGYSKHWHNMCRSCLKKNHGVQSQVLLSHKDNEVHSEWYRSLCNNNKSYSR